MTSGMLLTALAATLANTVVLALVFLYLAVRRKSRALWYFFATWTIYALRFVAAILNEMVPHPVFVALNQIFVVLSAFCLLYSFELWLEHRPFQAWGFVLPVATTGWIIWATLRGTSFLTLALPVFIYTGSVFLWSGIQLLASKRNRVPANSIVGTAFIVWGIHKFDYPFLRTAQWFAPWGFLIGGLAAIVIGVGTVLIYFERTGLRLNRTLRDREILVREVHHRVKNNLSIINALLGFQKDQFQDSAMQNAFQTVQNRVSSIALVHEQLLETERIATVQIGPYLYTLIDRLKESLASHAIEVNVERTLDDFEIDMDSAVPCGLIVSELLGNAYEHAFVGRTSGRIQVRLSPGPGDTVELSVTDDGVGMQASPGSGWSLIEALASQLDGTVRVERTGGTTVTVSFIPKPPRRTDSNPAD